MQVEDYYGAPTSGKQMPLRERLRTYYGSSDFVTVMNIDTEPVTYQFQAPQNMEFIQESAYEAHTEMVRPPERVTLTPGEYKLCPAYEADLMIEALIKQLVSRDMARKIEKGERNAGSGADWTDPGVQTDLIGKIFQGKEDLVSKQNSQYKADKAQVDKDLSEPIRQPAGLSRSPEAQ